MEETGILENPTSISLVLPDFEPGPNPEKNAATARRRDLPDVMENLGV
jgi:hypothetical protein